MGQAFVSHAAEWRVPERIINNPAAVDFINRNVKKRSCPEATAAIRNYLQSIDPQIDPLIGQPIAMGFGTGRTHYGIYVGNGLIVDVCDQPEMSYCGGASECPITKGYIWLNALSLHAAHHMQNIRFVQFKQPILPWSAIRESVIESIGPYDYDYYTRNCEHWVRFVTTKRRYSHVIERKKKAKTLGMLGVGVAGLGLGAAGYERYQRKK